MDGISGVGSPDRLDTIIISLREVLISLQNHVASLKAGIFIDWVEYIRYLMKYIFDEDQFSHPTLATSECRTMLSRYWFTEEEMLWIEHDALVIAIECVGETHAFLKTLSRHNAINGFYWEVNNYYDLMIRISYKTAVTL